MCNRVPLWLILSTYCWDAQRRHYRSSPHPHSPLQGIWYEFFFKDEDEAELVLGWHPGLISLHPPARICQMAGWAWRGSWSKDRDMITELRTLDLISLWAVLIGYVHWETCDCQGPPMLSGQVHLIQGSATSPWACHVLQIHLYHSLSVKKKKKVIFWSLLKNTFYRKCQIHNPRRTIQHEPITWLQIPLAYGQPGFISTLMFSPLHQYLEPRHHSICNVFKREGYKKA